MKYKDLGLPSVKYIINRINGYIELVPKEERVSKAYLLFDYYRSLLLHGTGAMDYFLYGFYNLNHRGKKNFVTLRQRVKYDYGHNTSEGIETVLNKEKALMHFAQYINRDWCGQQFHNSQEEYDAFEKKHDRFIVKPLTALGGHGVEILDAAKIRGGGYNLYQYCKAHNLMVEQLIDQHEHMNAMYPHAINTIRVLTLNGNVIATALRMGAGGGTIDNAHAGGIFAEVDKDTGIVISKAVTHKLGEYIIHPDTKTIIPGFQIPVWTDAIKLVTDACKLIPEVSLIGWDIAISKCGPTIVEVNNMPGLELVQAPNRHGLRYALDEAGKKK